MAPFLILVLGLAFLGWAAFRSFSPRTQAGLRWLTGNKDAPRRSQGSMIMWALLAFVVLCLLATVL